MGILLNVMEQGLIFSIVALGVYISYRILDFPDLSVDGTFPLGAAVTALCLMKGVSPLAACVLSFVAGAMGGFVTGVLHVKLKISNLLSGILVMISLYSINLRIMSKSNVPLFGTKTIFSGSLSTIVVIAIFTILVKIVLDLFLKTKLGFLLKAVGNNEQLVTSLGVDKDKIKVIGLMISNAFVALAGSMMAQYQGFSDVGMGTGTVVMGLAAVIIGESILGRVSIVNPTTMVVLGSVIYKGAVALALKLGLAPTDLKLVTAIIVVAALSLGNRKTGFKSRKRLITGGDSIAKDRKLVQDI